MTVLFLAVSLGVLVGVLAWASTAVPRTLDRLRLALDSLERNAAETTMSDDGTALSETLAGLGRR